MKICAVICEYNPFHNGHRAQLSKIRETRGCDKILCVMSGNFTQRGEASVFHKRVRARHAVENGADIVTELPAAFAAAPAELFARGAVKLISEIPSVTMLAFGCESGTKESFLATARETLREDKTFKTVLQQHMKDGASYIRARYEALKSLGGALDETLLSSPNNILGVEYCRSLLFYGSAVEPLPLLRTGAGYADTTVYKNLSSATALRGLLGQNTRSAKKALKRNLPESVLADALAYRPTAYRTAALCSLLNTPSEQIALAPDCSEGLENRLKSMARSNPDYDRLIDITASKRYTRARLKRILLQNFLGIRLKDVKEWLSAPLYHNVLAVKKQDAQELLAALSEGSFPAVTRRSDFALLGKDAAACFALDVRANDLYNALTGEHTNEFETLFV